MIVEPIQVGAHLQRIYVDRHHRGGAGEGDAAPSLIARPSFLEFLTVGCDSLDGYGVDSGPFLREIDRDFVPVPCLLSLEALGDNVQGVPPQRAS